MRTYSYRNMRNFRVGITVDGIRVGDEREIPLSLLVADDVQELNEKIETARNESRLHTRQNDIYWVFEITPEIDSLVRNLYASRQMINRYSTLRSQGKITPEESNSLAGEQSEAARIQSRLREKLGDALASGQGLFHGISRDASSLGKQPAEIFKKLWDLHVPDLYPKLEMGARQLKGDEAEEVLKAANLNALPQVFYELKLIKQEGPKFVPDPSAEIAKEVLDCLKREHSYGNKVTGKSLDEHFQGIGYGWERDMLRLVLAVLLRAGAIEVTYQGRRFRNHVDPQCRVPLTNNAAFRTAGFAPRESIDLKTLIAAVRNFEQLTGDEVDVEEGPIASALKKWATDEMSLLLPVVSEARANQLPVKGMLDEFRSTLAGIQTAASDDCVRIAAGEGKSLREARDRVRGIREAVSDTNLALLKAARIATTELWSVLSDREEGGHISGLVEELCSLITSAGFSEHLRRIDTLTKDIRAVYRELYLGCHQQRFETYAKSIDITKGSAEWPAVQESMGNTLLQPLTSRACVSTKASNGASSIPDLLPNPAIHCIKCGATVSQMESDLAAAAGLQRQVQERLVELTAPTQQIARVRVADFFGGVFDSVEAVDAAVESGSEQLRAELYKRVAEGARIILE